MTKTDKQILPALHNSGKVKDPDLSDIGERNYTSTILKYANLALPIPQLETDNKTVVGAINEINSNVIANPTDEPTDALSSIKIKDTVYSIEGGSGGSSTLAGLDDTDINSPTNKQFLAYSNGSHDWKNMSIDEILGSTTQASPCVFYSPVKADLLDCVLYITPDQTFGEGVPSPNNYRGISWYTQTTITNTSSYYNYFNGLFRQSRYNGSCWYIELSQLNWYYNEYYGVFTAALYENGPKSRFQSICSRDYNYAGPIENRDRANMTYGYRGSDSDAFWLRNDRYTDAEELKASLAGIYIIYESYYNGEPATVETFNNLVSVFGITGWAHQVSWTDLDFRVYGAEYYPTSGALYTTWVCERITPETTGYSFEDGYIIYDMSGWSDLPKVSASALCTNFRFEGDTYTPAEDYFSVKDNKLILNISSIGDTESDWVDWLTQRDYFEVTYEIANPRYTYRSPFTVPNFKNMNFISHSSVGTTKVQYYSGDAIPYINFTNTVINNAGVGDLGNVNINNAQNNEVLKYDSAAQIWVNGPVEVGEIDLSDIADVDLTAPTDGQVLTYDASSDTWINSSISGVEDLSDLSDVTVSSPTSGQILKYNGSIWVNSAESTGATTLDDLTDVTLTTPANGQVLKYDGSKWVNGADSTVSDLDDLSDVSIATPTSGQILKYNGSTWVNGAETTGATDLDELTDVTLTSPTAGQVLKYDGSKWVNDAGGSSVSDLDDLSDVTITTPTDGQALIYDSISGKWVNGAGGSVVGDLDDLSDVDITSPADGQALIYDAANDKWVNGAGGGSSTLSGLTDVTITSPANDQVLKYDSTTGKWINGTGGGGDASALNDLTDVAITSAANNDSLVYNSTNSEWENKQLSVSLTQAEYDALPTIDPTITYYITDGVADALLPKYSLTEQVVGQWIDGRPVCELTVDLGTTITLPQQDWYTTSISNSDKPIMLSATSISPTGMCFPLGCTRDSGTTLKVFNVRNTTVSCSMLIIKYVKSSS